MPSVPELSGLLEKRFKPDFLKPIAERLRSDPALDNWQLKQLVSLTIRLNHMQAHLRRANLMSDVSYMSWAARNLLELHVWTVYVSRSEENAIAFDRESMVDTFGTSKGGLKFIAAMSDHDEAEEAARFLSGLHDKLKTQLAAWKVNETDRYLRITDVAKQLKIGPDFEFYMLLCSKFVHSTGYSVLCSPTDEYARQIGDPIFIAGARSALNALDTIRDRLNELRIKAFE